MKRVLLLSHTTGYQLRAFNDAADALGIELVFATDRCHLLDDPWQDRAIPVRFFDVDESLGAIAQVAETRPLDGVIAVGDRPVVLAARAAEMLGIRWHSALGAAASTDKRRSRAALAAAGLASPSASVSPVALAAGSDDDSQASSLYPLAPLLGARGPALAYPVVLKPLGLSGSRGVIRANDEDEFRAALLRIRALLARPEIRASRSGLEDQILVEQYIDGREFAVEGVMTGGVLSVFAIFDKPDPLEGPFFEETIYVTPSRLPIDLQHRITDDVQRAALALGLVHGPVHAECRVTHSGAIYLLEIAARPIGGLCSRVLRFTKEGASVTASLETVLLEHAIGRSLAPYARDASAAAVMMIPIPSRGLFKRVSGEDDARAVPGVSEIRITAKPGQLLEPLPDAGSYLGFIFAHAPTPAAAEATVRVAHAKLTFAIARDLALSGA